MKIFYGLGTSLLALCLLSGCSKAERDRMERKADNAAEKTERTMDNAALTTSVKAKLAADVRLATLTSIDVDSSGSTVTLSGHVKTAEEKDYAESVAKTVDGVTSVINRLEVRP